LPRRALLLAPRYQHRKYLAPSTRVIAWRRPLPPRNAARGATLNDQQRARANARIARVGSNINNNAQIGRIGIAPRRGAALHSSRASRHISDAVALKRVMAPAQRGGNGAMK